MVKSAFFFFKARANFKTREYMPHKLGLLINLETGGRVSNFPDAYLSRQVLD